MNRVKIFTDSTSDLSKELLEKYDISVVPLYVIIDNKTYLDGVDLTTEELYKKVEETKTITKTAAVSMTAFCEAFEPWIKKGYDIVYCGISSKLSSTFQSAYLASQEFEEGRVRLIDSLNLSTGIGLLLVKAAELALAGMDAKTIQETITQIVPKVRSTFIIDTLKYLHMGGRCTSVQLLASNMLKIRPQIIVKDGGMIVGAKFRGKRQSCLDQYFDEVVGDGSRINPERVFITHSACSDEELAIYKDKLIERVNPKEIHITQAGTVISSHCGPGTVGILYIEK